jgi:hypothetical protein
MIKERVKQQVGHLLKPALGFGLAPEGTPLEQKLNDKTLSQEQIRIILKQTGHELALIHTRTGEGFGWIFGKETGKAKPMLKILKTSITRKFTGDNETWYEFLLNFFDNQTEVMKKIFENEHQTGKYHTDLSKEHREKLVYLHSQRGAVRNIFESRRELLSAVESHFLHGNVYHGNIVVNKNNTYAGLDDFSAALMGDPTDDLAYTYVMPNGKEFEPIIQSGWEETSGKKVDEENMRVLILWEAYRKNYTRYANHRYLDDYPEPLQIAIEELNNLK